MRVEKPLVSIIIPTFNRAHLIGETLDSVIAQTYQNWECIVVDDGSTDNTTEVLAEYVAKDSRIQFHHRPPEHKSGGNGARNYGFKLSKGEYVQWFDSDDIMLEEYLKYKIEKIANKSFIITSGFECDDTLNNKTRVEIEIEENLFTDYALWNLKVFTPSVLFRKKFLNEKEIFNEDLLRGQETDFFSRIFFEALLKEFEVFNVHLFLYRKHRDSKSSMNKKYRTDFQRSKAYINLNNFQRAFSIKNWLVVRKAGISILNLLLLAISHKDVQNYTYIQKKFGQLIKEKSRLKYFEFLFLTSLLYKTNRGRQFFKKRWINNNNHFLWKL